MRFPRTGNLLPEIYLFILVLLCSECFVCKAGKQETVAIHRNFTYNGISYARFRYNEMKYLDLSGKVVRSVRNVSECGHQCLRDLTGLSFNIGILPDANGNLTCEVLPGDRFLNESKYQDSITYNHYNLYTECERAPCGDQNTCIPSYETGDFYCACAIGFFGLLCKDVDECNGSSHGCPSSASCVNTHGSYYCTGYGTPWNLVARFSNADALNWMSDDGLWWFDLLSGVGDQLNPTINSDMISPLFWTKSGHKIKVTRSDDPTNTPLLVTTGDCLGGMTMRGLLTSFGNTKRDGSDSWPMDSCRHSCAVTYGGLYNITNGFEQSSCSGRVQSSNAIGFFCHGCTPDVCGDAAVMSIGGVGEECDRADHGIGVTEADFGKFTSEYGMADFGSDSLGKAVDYSLNLWVEG
ncbi:uncharacterized protein LOC125557118 [Nematostella vectensis]|uniref:uncharacterized protein LOC125557118 n=1 Tax=Nematostella vectensis TaxID=45351 RepID=UPI002077822C|nr:uncharacterized protein LOC125557118 [Nematostella vectensis]